MTQSAPPQLRAAGLAALRHVCEPLFGAQVVQDWAAEVVEPSAVPEPFSTLLRHNDHMTTTLELYYGEPVRLRVLGEQVRSGREATEYCRQIELLIGPGGAVVEFGVVRICLAALPPTVQDEILGKQRPLGEILIRHDLLRRIEPLFFYRFAGPSAMVSRFGRGLAGPVFGRTGRILCEERPAMELLEVVSAAEIDPPR